MPIIGGGSGSGGGSMSALSDSTLGANGTFTFSAIPQVYAHLLIVAQIRLTNASAFDNLVMRLNNDSAAHYGSQNVNGSQATAGAAEVNTSASPVIARVVAGSGTAGLASALSIFIPNYSSTTLAKEAVSSAFGGSALTTGTMLALTAGVSLNTTAAITQIDLFGATTANALAGSRATLYGLRAT